MADKARLLIECTCVGNCTILAFDKWDDSTEFYADIYTIPRNPTIRYRLRNAWRSLLGRPTYEPGMVIDGTEARRLSDWLVAELVDPSPIPLTDAPG